MPAYKVLKVMIKHKRKTNKELLAYCKAYYTAGKLKVEEYTELITEVEALQ